MKDLGSLMRHAQGMQETLQKAQDQLAQTTVEGVAGSGLVSVSLTGSGALTSVRIDEALFTDGDVETLQDLILAAHADAKTKLDAASKAMMEKAMGPLAGLAGGLPGLKL